MHQRAQTASLYRSPAPSAQHKHKHKHQDTLLKEIRTLHLLSAYLPRTTTNSPSAPAFSGHRSPLAHQLKQIKRIRGKPKKQFSWKDDQQRVCEAGWSEFLQGEMEKGVRRVREKVRRLKKRETVGTICLRQGVNGEEAREARLGEEGLSQLWRWARGGEPREERYLRMSDLGRDLKSSMVLRNAYQGCLKSGSHPRTGQESLQSGQGELRGQKLKSYVYLRENEHKLPKKRLDELYRDNLLLP